MQPTHDGQRPTAGELMDEQEAQRPDGAHQGLSPEEARKRAEQHRDAVAEGRARVGEADLDSGQNARDHRGTIHPSSD